MYTYPMHNKNEEEEEEEDDNQGIQISWIAPAQGCVKRLFGTR